MEYHLSIKKKNKEFLCFVIAWMDLRALCQVNKPVIGFHSHVESYKQNELTK